MKSVVMLSLILATVALLAQQTPAFSKINTPMPGVRYGSVAWGDYNNDSRLDILISGQKGSLDFVTQIYRNQGNFSYVPMTLPGVWFGSSVWADYDNDGDLDILITGEYYNSFRLMETITSIYKNENGKFKDIHAGMDEIKTSSVSWGDYDNDGDLDILMIGDSYPTIKLYRNNRDETFTKVKTELEPVCHGSVEWGDYDNDGYLDILLAGTSRTRGTPPISRVYRNNGDGTFIDIQASIPGAGNSAVWCDYDNDGYLDIFFAGYTSDNRTRTTELYRNNQAGNFEPVPSGFTPIVAAEAKWGDYDNDGYSDLIISGYPAITRVYHNNGDSTFKNIAIPDLPFVSASSVAWGDYDNDGNLDILVAGEKEKDHYVCYVLHNNCSKKNTLPNAPTNLFSEVKGKNVILHWDKSTDAETPQAALTYNIRIGTKKNGIDIVSPMANPITGYRIIAKMGNVQHVTSYQIKKLPSGTYYWSVQTIDGAFAGSSFANEVKFIIP